MAYRRSPDDPLDHRLIKSSNQISHPLPPAQRELELQRQLCASQHYSTPQPQKRNREQLSPPSSCSSVNGQPTSLFNELMSCDGDSDDLNKPAGSHLDKNGNQILDLTMLTEDSDEIECDITDEECDWKLKSELLAMYQSMRQVCAELNRRKEDRNSLGPFSAQDSGVSESPSPISELQLSSALLQQLRKEFKAAFSDFLTECDEEGVRFDLHFFCLCFPLLLLILYHFFNSLRMPFRLNLQLASCCILPNLLKFSFERTNRMDCPNDLSERTIQTTVQEN